MVAAEELRGMSESELEVRERDLREQLFKLRFQKTTGQVENAARLRAVRSDLARVLTVQRQRQLGVARDAETASASN
jgi:large subunit ribosomal protein L29